MGRDIHSLILRHDGTIYHNDEEKNRLPANSLPQEGDIVVSVCVFERKYFNVLGNVVLSCICVSEMGAGWRR